MEQKWQHVQMIICLKNRYEYTTKAQGAFIFLKSIVSLAVWLNYK